MYGYVESNQQLLLLIGAAGSGKTHTKYLVLNRMPPLLRQSTPLAERPIKVVRISTMGDQLEEVGNMEFDDMLADAVVAGVPLDRPRFPSILGKMKKTVGKVFKHAPGSPTTKRAAETTAASPTTTPRSASSSVLLQEACEGQLEELAGLVQKSFGSKKFLDVDWLYIVDSGGQRQFHEILPAFLQQPAMCIFVTKLSEMLRERPTVEYYEAGKLMCKPHQSRFTNEEILKHCLQTIQSQQADSSNPTCKLAVVGTYRDKEHECLAESREEKNKKLVEILSPTFDKSLVYYGQNLKEPIFPVNAKFPDLEDRKVAEELRRVILEASSGVERRKTPVNWYMLEQMIHKTTKELGRGVLSRDECFQIARKLHFSEKAFDAALDHLVSLNVIHYYRNLLPEVVFADVQVLLDKVTELVKYHYQLRYNPDSVAATSGELRKFRDEGRITLKLLNQFPEHYTELFTPEGFLKLMQDRLITAQQIGGDEYMMPCLLPMLEPDEVAHQVSPMAPASPLVITFPNGWAPHGVYCSLAAFLLSFLKLVSDPNDLAKPACLARNCIKFRLPEGNPGSFTLIDTFSRFEIHVKAKRDVCTQLCPLLYQTIQRGLEKAASTLHYGSLCYEAAFLCEHKVTAGSDSSCSQSSSPHIATISKNQQWLTCQLDPENVSSRLKERHLMWFHGKGE